ncbi:hypothetical protein [Vulcanisaeta sp. JCM 14467]|uniref:hypothetical protein n=1 Tax=Vulcanisaeta sp. JCM 14467 TaxID=1295370 RepID=UPI000B33BDBB|nr:hypothetical protein [Vulcanisaeta sp. JCM 14467]
MPFKAKYYIYWVDTDAAGIAHFTSFLRLVERAEEDFYRMNGILHYHSIAPRRELFITYTAPLRRVMRPLLNCGLTRSGPGRLGIGLG